MGAWKKEGCASACYATIRVIEWMMLRPYPSVFLPYVYKLHGLIYLSYRPVSVKLPDNRKRFHVE